VTARAELGPRLAELEARITRLLSSPDALAREASLWSRWSARWRTSEAPLETEAARALGEAVFDAASWEALAVPVLDELTRNVERLEVRALAERPLEGEALAWMADLVAWLARVEAAREVPPRFAQLTAGLGRRRAWRHRRLGAPARPSALARVESILDEAAVETSRLGRRRRLLEAARRSLLDVEDSLGDDGSEVAHAHALSACITRELMEASRLESLGVSLDRDLDAELRARLGRRDRRAASVARALAWLDAPRARREALDRLAHDASAADDARTPLGEAITRTFERARARVEQALAAAPPAEALGLRRHRRALEGEAPLLLLRATRLADALLETGGGLSQARFLADDRATELVHTPSERLRLVPAQSVDDLARAVLDDPRRLVHQLASGELLTRRYARPRQRDRRHGGPSAEVRLFLLDGSSSMQGRARAHARRGDPRGDRSALGAPRSRWACAAAALLPLLPRRERAAAPRSHARRGERGDARRDRDRRAPEARTSRARSPTRSASSSGRRRTTWRSRARRSCS
jgi:hypothetical protein